MIQLRFHANVPAAKARGIVGEVVLGAVGALGGGRAAALSSEQHLALLSFLCDEALDTAALRNVLQSAPPTP